MKASLRLSFRIQGKPSTWSTFWLPYSRPAMLPTLVICYVHDPATADSTLSTLFTSNNSLLLSLLVSGIFHFVPAANSTPLFMSRNQTPGVVIGCFQSLSCRKYACWTEYFFQLSNSVDANLCSVNHGVDR